MFHKNVKMENQEKIKTSEKDIPATKKCSKCNLIKDEKEFDRNSNSYSGLDSRCKLCRTENYYKELKNKEYIIEVFKLFGKDDIFIDFYKSMEDLFR